MVTIGTNGLDGLGSKTHSSIPGYVYDVVPGVNASYNVREDKYASCGIRIRMSETEFKIIENEVKVVMTDIMKPLAVKNIIFRYDPRGFGEMEYQSYVLDANEKAVKSLKAVASGIDIATTAPYALKVLRNVDNF